MGKHAPLYYATYLGPEPVTYIGEGRVRRGYTCGSTVQISKEDADEIKRHLKRPDVGDEFDVEPVPTQIIGTAEENHPIESTAVHKHNERMAEYT